MKIGLVYGPEAIEKYQAEAFKNRHFSNHLAKCDQYGAHMIGTDGTQVWRNGDWSLRSQIRMEMQTGNTSQTFTLRNKDHECS